LANLYTVQTSRKTEDFRDPRSRHIDEWVRVSDDYRNRTLGEDWFQQMEAFYSLTDQGGPMPSFRPLVRMPELQTLMMREANDLTEVAPRPYILNNKTSDRDKKKEEALQAEWRRSQVNYHSMYAILMSMFSGMCPIQIGFDPNLYNGKGGIWTKYRDPKTFACDPFTTYDLDWSYIILEDRQSEIPDMDSKCLPGPWRWCQDFPLIVQFQTITVSVSDGASVTTTPGRRWNLNFSLMEQCWMLTSSGNTPTGV